MIAGNRKDKLLISPHSISHRTILFLVKKERQRCIRSQPFTNPSKGKKAFFPPAPEPSHKTHISRMICNAPPSPLPASNPHPPKTNAPWTSTSRQPLQIVYQAWKPHLVDHQRRPSTSKVQSDIISQIWSLLVMYPTPIVCHVTM